MKGNRVLINGKPVTEPWFEIDPVKDSITLDGKKVRPRKQQRVVYALNKPRGYLSSMSDDRGRKTIADLIKGKIPEKVFHVGRLDMDTEGLIILTNDGELARKLSHPSSKIRKTYVARVTGKLSHHEIKRLENGVVLRDGFKTSGASIRVIRASLRDTLVEIIIHEGHKREIREMFKVFDKHVLYLKRTAIGSLKVDIVPNPGDIKKLTGQEIQKLLK
ncbi:pseudouridine synthase [Kosmotoga olearia]|uniref:pseudouridine synthase n=2 Tax=Kosmotoga TaxID=651456 RepID=UPI0009FE328F